MPPKQNLIPNENLLQLFAWPQMFSHGHKFHLSMQRTYKLFPSEKAQIFSLSQSHSHPNPTTNPYQS